MSKAKLNNGIEHQNIELKQNSIKLKVLRQDRHVAEEGQCSVIIANKSFPVSNYSYFGIGILSNVPFDTVENKNSLSQIPFVIHGVHLVNLNLKVIRNAEEDGSYTVGFEILGEPLPLDRIRAVQHSHSVTENHLKIFSTSSQVPLEFKALVLSTKDWLEQLHNHIKGLKHTESISSHTDIEGYEDTFAQVTGNVIGNKNTHGFGSRLEADLSNRTRYGTTFFSPWRKGYGRKGRNRH